MNKSATCPAISICIPTYNRAHLLKNLFESIYLIKLSCGEAVEICISNNNSSDKTSNLINDWKPKLSLKVITQKENIGSTRNCIEVTKLASGRWIHLVGDDDTLIPGNYLALIESIKGIKNDTWLLAGVDGENNREIYLSGFLEGSSTSSSFKWRVLKTGLSRYSFIGQHIFPATHLSSFHNLPLKAFIPWPHLGLFLIHLGGCGEVLVRPQSIVKQAGGGQVLFWRADDWASMQLSRLQIIKSAKQGSMLKSWFYDALLLREIYGLVGLKSPTAWKIHEPVTFNKNAAREYAKACFSFGYVSILIVPYMLLIFFLRVMPHKIIDYSPCKGYLAGVRKRYALEKAKPEEFDGMKRKV